MSHTLSRLLYQAVRLVNRIQTRRFEVRFAETEDDLRQVWRLNYETYVQELGQEQASPELAADGLLPDRLRETSVYIIALHRGRLVGMMALTLPSGPFSIESSLSDPHLLDGLRDQTIEYRRLAVKPAYRGKGVFLRMADLSLQWAFSAGYRYAIISALERQIPTYARLGYRAIDRPFVKGACTYQPMINGLDRFRSSDVEKAELPLATATIRKLPRD